MIHIMAETNGATNQYDLRKFSPWPAIERLGRVMLEEHLEAGFVQFAI
jgi:hypothetical protein